VLSSCPVELPKRLRWLQSGRFIRLLSSLVALAVLSAILYNAIMIDRLPPTVSLTVSSLDSHGRATTLTSIDITFSEEVRHDSAEAAFAMTQLPGTSKVAGAFHWQGLTLIFTPSARLPLAAKFHVHLGPGVLDIAGNVQSGSQDVEFTTEGSPVVVAADPAPDTTAVPVDASIKITFDRLMDTQKVIAGVTLKPDITYQASWNGPVLILVPTRPMIYGTTYTVTIGDPAVDKDGTKLAAYTTSFRTVGIGLRVTSSVPAPNVDGVSVHSQIAVTFDRPIEPSSITGAIKLSPSVSGSINAVSLSDDSPSSSAAATPAPGSGPQVLVFTPDAALAPDTTYTVTLEATVKTTDGQVEEGKTWRFITGEPAANALNQIAFISHRSGVDNVWLMNPDGSNQRELTWELVPVSGYDISGDGTTLAYGAGGSVKTMSITGSALNTLTPSGSFEYAPTITQDGTGVIVGRRDTSGADKGYWRYPLVTGTDVRQVALDGAPGPGSAQLNPDGLTGAVGMTAWMPRAAYSSDGKKMLVVRGADDLVELVDIADPSKAIRLSIQGDSRPVWSQADSAFYLAASMDRAATWSCWRVELDGSLTSCGAARSDVAGSGTGLAVVVNGNDGAYHVSYEVLGQASSRLLMTDPDYSEASPSFSPDGGQVVVARVAANSPLISAGIWKINVDGTGLTVLATDGSRPHWVP